MRKPSDVLAQFTLWREQLVKDSAFECTPIAFAQSNQWRLQGGYLRHTSGGFFSVVGLRSTGRHPRFNDREQIIIYQPQIAINGYLAQQRADQGLSVLCQGRVEPGNVDVMQLAPTIQSTEANIKRLHGGRAPPLVDWFIDPCATLTITDGLQSEEGSRYHGKYNRNAMLRVPDHAEIDIPANFRWCDLDDVRTFVTADNVLNTDSRSVLACCDWDALAGAQGPFAGAPLGTFGADLRRSYCVDVDSYEISNADLLSWLIRLRVDAALRNKVVPINELGNWVITDDVICERGTELGFAVRQYQVVALGREVDGWDQPLVDSNGVGRITLVCQKRQGVLQFLITPDYQVGYIEGVQLCSGLAVPPGESIDATDPLQRELAALIDSEDRCTRHVKCRQSEEGGRFYMDENDYEVVELDPDVELAMAINSHWITLAQIRELIQTPGVFTIEMRGALAMLLAFA